jgi:hypothetical protein
MGQKNPNYVEPSGVIPNDPNPSGEKGIPFSVSYRDESGEVEFNPVYYPDRYRDTMQKEVDRDSRQCGGEDVSIDTSKNPEFHATGIVLDGNVSDFRNIRNHMGPVDLITPLTDSPGGMEVIVTKGQIGEIVGWDGLYKQWQFNYTLDMVATGSDTDDGGDDQIVSEVLEQYRNLTTSSISRLRPGDEGY